MNISSRTIKSNFETFGVAATLMSTIICIVLIIWMIYVWIVDVEEIGLFQRLMITFFPSLVTPLLLRVEIPKIKRLEIGENGLTITNPFTGHRTFLVWDRFDGYQTMNHVTRSGLVNELFLVLNGNVVHEVSSHYYKNYKDIRNALASHLRPLGQVDLKYFYYLRQKFVR